MSSSESDRFSADCGLEGPLELGVTSPGQDGGQQRLALAQPFATVGRDSRAAVCLPHADVSRHHAYLQVLGGRVFAVDLESRAGISLEGVPRTAGWLEPGQPLAVGPYLLDCLAPAPPPGGGAFVGDPLEDPLPASGSLPQVSCDILLGDRHVGRWRVTRPLTLLGSSGRCRVRLRDASVSRVHCSFVVSPRGVWVVDLLSREGTRLRGGPVAFARLEDGDTVEVGDYRLRVDYHRGGRQPEQAAPPPGTAVAARPPGGPPVVLVRDENKGELAPPAAAAGAAEQALLVPLMQQFNALQQHMFDQFQQTIVMLVQMMSSMHKEQASLIREELAEFRKASEELNRLQEQLRNAPAPTAARPAAAEPPVRQAPAGAWPAAQPQPAGELPARTAGPPAAGQAGAPGEIKEPVATEAVHAWLTGRIAELQNERQTRWQRILSFIRGS